MAATFKKLILILAMTLVASTFTSTPVAFAAPPGQPFEDLQSQVNELEATTAQLQQDLEDKETQLEAAIALLEEKDQELMDKDQELMDKDQELMDKDSELMEDVETLCTNTPVFKGAVQTVGGQQYRY